MRLLPLGFIETGTECLSKSSAWEKTLIIATAGTGIILFFLSVVLVGKNKKNKTLDAFFNLFYICHCSHFSDVGTDRICM